MSVTSFVEAVAPPEPLMGPRPPWQRAARAAHVFRFLTCFIYCLLFCLPSTLWEQKTGPPVKNATKVRVCAKKRPTGPIGVRSVESSPYLLCQTHFQLNVQPVRVRIILWPHSHAWFNFSYEARKAKTTLQHSSFRPVSKNAKSLVPASAYCLG